MNDTPDRVLDVIEPPRGGWERLRARRDVEELARAPWLAFAAGLAVAAVGTLVSIQLSRPSLTLPPTAARLLGEPVADAPPRMLDAARASPLSESDGVKVYWAERPEG